MYIFDSYIWECIYYKDQIHHELKEKVKKLSGFGEQKPNAADKVTEDNPSTETKNTQGKEGDNEAQVTAGLTSDR